MKPATRIPVIITFALALAALALAACDNPFATPAPTPMPATHTPIPTQTPAPTHTPAPTATQTLTPTQTLTSTATATPTQTSTATHTPTFTATNTPTPTPTATATNTPIPTPTPIPPFTALSAAANHTCGLRADGGVTCRGTLDSPAPGERFTAITTGGSAYLYGDSPYPDGRYPDHACGLRQDAAFTAGAPAPNSRRRTSDLPQSAPAPTTFAACAPTEPPYAGAA